MTASMRAATDPAASAWVSANAGAGKTHLLTDRVTRLLLSGTSPSHILCLTYTKAAAAEMATRLFERLGEWTLLSDDKLREKVTEIGAEVPDARHLRKARTLFAQALETPGGLKIQTIHSFCQHVLARFPVEAGIPARFTVLDERSAAELMTQARNLVLERAGKSDMRLAAHIGLIATRAADARFAEILDCAIADRGRIRDLLVRHGGAARLFAHVRQTLGVAEGETEATVVARFCAELRAESGALKRIVHWLLDGSKRDVERGEKLAQFLESDCNEESFEQLRRALLKLDGDPYAPIGTQSLNRAAPELAAAADHLQQRLLAAEERRKCAATAALTEAVLTVALAVVESYEGLKRGRAALDYEDLIHATLKLLEERNAASWVLYKLDGGLDHILVDEAQDTSPEQWRIVEKLSEEFFAGAGRREGLPVRTIFAVGDEKQSIFSFQGAEPAEFARHRDIFQARADDADLDFVDWRPPVSRRSARAILEYVDAVFESDQARDGLSSSNDRIHHDPFRAEIGRVEIWPTVKAPATPEVDLWGPVDALSRNSAQVTLAASIASRIAKWIADGVLIPGTDRRIRPGNIMILVRRRNAFAEEMIRQLLDRHIQVAGADRMVLMEQIAIADLVALGRFALLPEDDLNLAALLKSPLVGFSEDELYALSQPRSGSLWAELRGRKDERPIFASAHEMLAGALGSADFVPPFEFYAHALGKGMRKRLVARLGAEAADAIDEFLALALAHEGSHPPSLESFLHWFEEGASDVKRDMEKAGGAVRVMTVHGAKGLEANVVILPDTAQVPDHERRGPLLYTEDCILFGVPKALECEAVRQAKAAARAAELREYRRLLYVAATRAREFLVIGGYETKQATKPEAWYPHLRSAAERIGHPEEIGGETVLAIGAPLAAGAGEAQGAERLHASLPPFLFEAAQAEPPSRILRPSAAAGLDEPALLSPLADQAKRFRRGLLLHTLLARLPELAPEMRKSAALAFLARQGIAAADAKTIAEEILAILTDAVFAPLFAQDSRAEVAIAAHLPELGHARISGQIDRLAVTAESVLVADFKTNRPPPATVEDTPRLYRTQMALYRAALQKIYPDKRIDCALIWTNGARLMPLPAELLDAELAQIAAAGNGRSAA